MAASARLKLRAKDVEDMRVIAAFLQDALVPLKDVVYQRREKRFVMVANRFRWEKVGTSEEVAIPAEPNGSGPPAGDARFEDEAARATYERVNCGVRFDKVRNVRVKGLDLRRRDQFLNLLTVDAEPSAVTMVFSDGAAIRLDLSDIACHLEDLGEPWPTRWRPQHRLDDGDASG